MVASKFRLDELYKMTTHIYSEQNAHRPASATFAHFVEVCGLLTIHTRKKKRENVTFEDALCKALGWYFPLLAKFRVASVEELVFRKFPNACPYCRECPHVDAKCKAVKGTSRTVDHDALERKYVQNSDHRPYGLRDWQDMFNRIYPRTPDDTSKSVVGLFEELGELAEAVRVFDRFPKFFAGEAADVFSYLMGLANEYSLQREQNDQPAFDFETEFLNRFPGLCVQCGYPVCVCPLVPEATVGRMAKELDIRDMGKLFVPSFEVFRAESSAIADRVLDSLGGYTGLATKFPFDRGEANRALVMFCLKLAAKVDDAPVAERLRSAAIKTADSATFAGSRKHTQVSDETLELIRQVLREDSGVLGEILQGPDSSFTDKLGGLVINELVMGNKIVNSATLVQGADAAAESRFNTAWDRLASKTDLAVVTKELEVLRGQLEVGVPSDERKKALAALDEAESASRTKNGPRLLKALSTIGNWATDVGIKLGTGVIVGLIKDQSGT